MRYFDKKNTVDLIAFALGWLALSVADSPWWLYIAVLAFGTAEQWVGMQKGKDEAARRMLGSILSGRSK